MSSIATVNPYSGLIIFTAVASLFAIGMILASTFLGPLNKTKTKMIPFECGAVPVGVARDMRFNVRFYLVAVLFILFDIEIIFMYPWAVNIKALGIDGMIAMMSFMAVLGVGLVYVWKKGILDWNKA